MLRVPPNSRGPLTKNYLQMKYYILSAFWFVAVFLSAQTLTHVIGQPEGFVTLNGGVTGGEGGPVIIVTNAAELRAAVDGVNTPVIVLVSGTINVSGEIPARGNKTIVGLGTGARIAGGGFGWNTKSNVIVQNITFEDASDDLLKINNKCKNFWIDHCTFSDGAGTNAGSHDGMLDITRGSEFVTVSYCRFFNHDKNILIGHSDSETGDVIMKVTLHNNWFDGTVQRNPRVRYATVHCYNNYHVNNRVYGIASACNANVLVENSYFKDTQIPLQVGVPGYSPEGFLVQRGCYFENCGPLQLKEKDMTSLFPYNYTLDDVMYVPCIAQTYVGADKQQRTSQNFNCNPVVPGEGTGGSGGNEGPNPGNDGCIWVKNNIFNSYTDVNGWFWFNNLETSNLFIPSMIKLADSQSSSGAATSLLVTKLGAGTNGTVGGAGALTGCIELGRSGTKGIYTGGSATFQLQSCGEFKLSTSRTGDNLFNVSTSDSQSGPFTQKFVYSSSSGISNVDISQHVQSDVPIWVRITNGATGSLNIHGVTVKSYEKNCPTNIQVSPKSNLKLGLQSGYLFFEGQETSPAEIRIFAIDGRTIDVPFRGWVEGGVENSIRLNFEHLKSGVYIIMFTTNKEKTAIKFQK